jgi:hypothetical protein
MSFFSTIADLGKSALNFLSGNGIGSQLAKMALTGYALNQVTQNVNKSNQSTPSASVKVDPGVRIQIDPDQNNRIPVLYGESFVPGIVTDAHLSTDQATMTYVFTLCELTGTKISDSTPSTYEFEDVYLNDQRVVFKSDGITADYTMDRNGVQDLSVRDLVTVRFYVGGSPSAFQQGQQGGYAITPINCWDVVPTWTPLHAMNDLLFAVITVKYNAEKGLKALPTVLFHLRNSMSQPGDCLWDFATNTRYGAGIAEEDIFRE